MLVEPCTQCGEPIMSFIGPVCGKCCRSNQLSSFGGKGKARTETAAGRKFRREYHDDIRNQQQCAELRPTDGENQ